MLLFLVLLSLNHVLSNSLTLSPFLILKCIPKIVCVCVFLCPCVCTLVCVHMIVFSPVHEFFLFIFLSTLKFRDLWNRVYSETVLVLLVLNLISLFLSLSLFIILWLCPFTLLLSLWHSVCVCTSTYVIMLVHYKTFEMYGLISRIMYNVCLWRSNYLGFRILLSKQGKYNHRYVVGKDLWPRLLRAQGTRLPFQHYWVNTRSPGTIQLDA